MSAESSDDLLQNADQLFDENKFQEAVDILRKHPVRFCTLCFEVNLVSVVDGDLFLF